MLQCWDRYAAQFHREPRRLFTWLAVFALVSTSLFLLFFHKPTTINYFDDVGRVYEYTLPGLGPDNTTWTAADYANDVIRPPYKGRFWDVGQRCRRLVHWLSAADELQKGSKAQRELVAAIETVAVSLFPFLIGESKSPLADLRASFVKGSRGIVIPVGGTQKNVRYASHLIASLRDVFDCQLPIQIAYAGDSDLKEVDRDRLAVLHSERNVEFLDVLTVFDDTTLKLAEGGWAVKSFAALASRFEQVIVLDADSVFLQTPEALYNQQGFVQHGAYLFHDRLLWKHEFRDRHDWWEDQIKEPSPAMTKSRVWMDDYAEECDSGVVVLDKSRPEVFMGLLHTTWQNTYEVREEVTYKITYGDKESWWLGLELAGAGYEFEDHYGSMLGWTVEIGEGEIADGLEAAKACSFVIAHLDDDEKLIWYNGGLLKNKLLHHDEFEIPEVWMMDGVWRKGSKKEMSCMLAPEATALTDDEKGILGRSIDIAKKVDEALKAQPAV